MYMMIGKGGYSLHIIYSSMYMMIGKEGDIAY